MRTLSDYSHCVIDTTGQSLRGMLLRPHVVIKRVAKEGYAPKVPNHP